MKRAAIYPKLKSHTIEFKVKGVKKSFTIIHDMPDMLGLSIEDALDNWLARTNKYTADSFVAYVNSKNTGSICMTEEKYKSIIV